MYLVIRIKMSIIIPVMIRHYLCIIERIRPQSVETIDLGPQNWTIGVDAFLRKKKKSSDVHLLIRVVLEKDHALTKLDGKLR